MSAIGDDFKALKERGQRKRASNRKTTPDLLRVANIDFESKNGGAHLIVDAGDHKVDFWPGTGRWIDRKGKRGFGVRKLIEHVYNGR